VALVVCLLVVTVTAAWATSRELAQAQELMDRCAPFSSFISNLQTRHAHITPSHFYKTMGYKSSFFAKSNDV
jgi:hypothetical protein